MISHVTFGEFFLTTKDYLITITEWSTDGLVQQGTIVDEPANSDINMHERGATICFENDGSISPRSFDDFAKWGKAESPGELDRLLEVPRLETMNDALIRVDTMRNVLAALNLIPPDIDDFDKGREARFIVGRAMRLGLIGSVFQNVPPPYKTYNEPYNVIAAYGLLFRINRFGHGHETIAHETTRALNAYRNATEI